MPTTTDAVPEVGKVTSCGVVADMPFGSVHRMRYDPFGTTTVARPLVSLPELTTRPVGVTTRH